MINLTDYVTSDTPDYEFCKAPKALFRLPELKKLSGNAKLLYIAILDRLSLSIKNGWRDEEGKVYVYFSLEDVCDEIFCSASTAVRLFQELDDQKGVGLITRKRLGLGKTSVIYVRNPLFEINKAEHTDKGLENITETLENQNRETENAEKSNAVIDEKPISETEKNDYPQPVKNENNSQSEDVFFEPVFTNENHSDQKSEVHISENEKSGLIKNIIHDLKESAGNNNKINKNKLNNNNFNNNNINQSILPAKNILNQKDSASSVILKNPLPSVPASDKEKICSEIKNEGWIERIEKYKNIIKNNISYETLVYSIRRNWLDEIVELMADSLCSGGYVKINNITYPPEAVKERFLSLKSDHIEYVRECLDKNSVPVRNMRAYMLTVLYRAPETMLNWYEAEVKKDYAFY